MIPAHLSLVRRRIAQLVLDSGETPAVVGRVELKPHQQTAARRLRAALDEFGAALLCDPVGTGKTFVALALAPGDSETLVLAPAVLGNMWREAASLCEKQIRFLSVESLSRGHVTLDRVGLVIVDEAHHLRNPATRRYAAASQILSDARAVFLTATPIHNRRTDLAALLGLVLGDRASHLENSAISRIVTRREQLVRELPEIPSSDDLVWCSIPDERRILEILLSLPPPVPPRDGGDGGALVAFSLVRQWASSDAALRGALRRRLIRAESLEAALTAGEWPSQNELKSWIAGEDSVQLAFPGVLSASNQDTAALLGSVRAHRDAIDHALRHAAGLRSDEDRISLLRKLRQIHSGSSIVAFSQYADTVEGLFRLISGDGYVAVLTGAVARVAGGSISRRDAIAAFAPFASGRTPPRRSESITLLLTTDLLSEGVNLQDAGVVVHLDLPWTPARMEQRLGRVARIGSRHERVHSYALRPPAASDLIVRIDKILSQKADAASLVNDFRSLRLIPALRRGVSPTSISESITSILDSWRDSTRITCDDTPAASAVQAPLEGFLAAARINGRIELIAAEKGVISDEPEMILRCARRCSGNVIPLSLAHFDELEATLRAWIFARSAIGEVDHAGHARRRAARAIDRAASTARPHERALIARKAATARAGLTGRLGAYREQLVSAIASEAGFNSQMLDRIIESCGTKGKTDNASESFSLEAIIALVSEKSCCEQQNADVNPSEAL